jgi:hypothetical protein
MGLPRVSAGCGGTAFKFGVLTVPAMGPDQRWTKDRGLSRCLPPFAAVIKYMINNDFCKGRRLPALRDAPSHGENMGSGP